jgi:hypothetical protein
MQPHKMSFCRSGDSVPLKCVQIHLHFICKIKGGKGCPPSYLDKGDSVNAYGCFSWKKSRLGKNIPVYCIGYYNVMVYSCFHLKLFKSVVKTEFVIFGFKPSHTADCHVCRMYHEVYILNRCALINPNEIIRDTWQE